jgi:hypothetical protein
MKQTPAQAGGGDFLIEVHPPYKILISPSALFSVYEWGIVTIDEQEDLINGYAQSWRGAYFTARYALYHLTKHPQISPN